MPTTIDFDDLSPGTPLTTLAGVTFVPNLVGPPSVFTPTNVTTQTPPNAVHAAGLCLGTGTCPNGANRIDIRFDHPVASVSWRVGLNDEPAGEFGTPSELVGYDAGGHEVATSTELELGVLGFTPITREFKADSSNVDIVRAVLTVGLSGTARRANVDHLVFDDRVVPPPPAPTVRITSPAADQTFDRIDDIRVSGRVDAPAGVNRFCITVTPTPPPDFPDSCDQRAMLNADGTFANIRAGPFTRGANQVTAWVENGRFLRASHTVPITLRETDLRVTTMEVTQAIQDRLPIPSPGLDDVAHTASYNGLPLIARKGTVVRVWGSARLDAVGNPVRGVAAYLYGFRSDGTPLPRGPLSPIEGLRDVDLPLASGLDPFNITWSNPGTSWTFVLPGDWTDAGPPITLRAVVNPPTAFPRVNECAGCAANNAFTLEGISFERAPAINIWPFRVTWRDSAGNLQAPEWDPLTGTGAERYFDTTRTVSPFVINVRPYQGFLGAQAIADRYAPQSDEANDAVFDRLTDAIDIGGYPGFHTVALNTGGLARGKNSDHFSWTSFTVRNYSVMDVGRPLTSVAHELYHGIGFEHAGRSCPGAVDGGGAVFWPPDDRGLLHGVGADIRPAYRREPLTLYGLRDPSGGTVENFDFMSYCAPNNPESNTWISEPNWRAAKPAAEAARATAGVVRAAARAAREPTLAVNAGIVADRGQILRIEPGGSRTSLPGGDGTVRIVVRDAAGRVVSDTPVAPLVAHVDPVRGRGVTLVRSVAAVVPATDAASVELVAAGRVLDVRHRSGSAPRVTLLSPRRGARIRARRALALRWRARDPDGDRLKLNLEFSSDGGQHFKAIAVGLQGSSFKLAPNLLRFTHAGILRLRASDGWNEASAVVRRLRIAGPAPAISLSSPPDRARIPADQVLTLEASAFDDHDRVLNGRALRWFDGPRLLGRGRRISVLGLAPRLHTIQVVARDRRGHTGRARKLVRVTPVKPRFIVLQAPRLLSRRARRLAIRAAASVPGVLSIGGRVYAIDRRTRRFRLPLRAGPRPLAINLKLRAGGRTTRVTLRIPRR